MVRLRIWLRWSRRDLRRRWLLVAAIALVIALGTGTYAGLLGTSAWRTQSNDASFALLHTHDLRVSLPQGSLVPEGRLREVVAGLDPADVAAARERLVVPTQIAGAGGLLVTGELVGTDTAPGGPVDGVWVTRGRGLGAADDGAAVVVAEHGFASKNGLGVPAELTVSGGSRLEVVGHGQSPEYFLITGAQGAGTPFLSQRSYGVLFGSLHTVQRAAGAPGQVNDLVLTLAPDADRDAVAARLREALAGVEPPVAATVTTREDIDAYRILYEDIDGDAQLWRVIALLVLLGAAFAAFNLTTRIVEAQRREIGIGMALGVSLRWLAVRPLLFGTQVALLGAVLGMAVGWAVGLPLREVFTDLVPLPVWRTPLQLGVFAQAAALGFLLPLVGVAWPVWRAIRVQPVEAIRVGHLAARGGGWAPLLRRLRLPGRGYRQIPLRNVLRTPRRSLLTVLGIAAAITTLVTTFGLLDTFRGTLDVAEDELLHAAPERVGVTLDRFTPLDDEVVRAVAGLPEVGTVAPGLLLGGTAAAGDQTVELLVEVLPEDAAWRPRLERGAAGPGLILASKAADDLGVGPGGTVRLEHPQASDGGLRTVVTEVPVAGVHANPMRMLAYLDPVTAAGFGFGTTTNLLTVTPAAGTEPEAVRRALLAVPHVASAQTAEATTEAMRESINEFVGILQVAGAVTLLLTLLIAFNTTSIGVDERAREHATMLAFGLPQRTVLGMTVVETVLVGALGSAAGLAGGYLLLRWMTAATLSQTMPEIGVVARLSAATLAGAFLLGVVAVAVAPVLALRRLRRMDIPSTLRVME